MSVETIVSTSNIVCLVGGATVEKDAISAVFPNVDAFVGVDGGAEHLMRAGVAPAAVIGDLDSLGDHARATFADVLCHVAEQSTTDFEKAVLRVEAPLILGLGFTGGRIDHVLSALNVMARHIDRAIVLADVNDACFVTRIGQTVLDVPDGTRVSIMPLGPATVTSRGLEWSFDETLMTPDGFTSPSNAARAAKVTITTDGPVLVTLPRAFLPQALQAAVRAK